MIYDVVKKIVLPLLMVFYVVQYEAHTWDPCSYDRNTGSSVCFAIMCPSGGCHSPEEINFCSDMDCVKKIVNKEGTEHLNVYKIRVDKWAGKNAVVQRLNPIASYDFYDIEE